MSNVRQSASERADRHAATGPAIAIIAMAGRFPGAATPEALWENLVADKQAVRRFAPEELEVSAAIAAQPGYVPARSVLDDVDLFDAALFHIYPREAEQMDPQHRIFLEICWEALERAGHDPQRSSASIGVFAGSALNTYLLHNLAHDRTFLERFTADYQAGSYITMMGNDKDFLPTRVSWKLNLRGPSVTVQTACSTSLVAVCQACQSLLTYGCDMALAGGVSITFPQHRGYLPEEGGIVSLDGVVRPFDHRAQGTVFGAGAGVVVLKRLEDAEADGDTILAVIRGFATNNDGSGKSAYTAPSVEGQSDVIVAAQEMAGVAPETITYIEAHGTGTPLGDPIEMAGLDRAYRTRLTPTKDRPAVHVGTVKGHLGHLDVASGITGLIKTVLQMRHRQITGLAHFEVPNPEIVRQFADSRVDYRFSAKPTAWEAGAGIPLRAGVSAFGVGGTNAHVVVEEYTPKLLQDSGIDTTDPQILLLSARTPAALEQARLRLAEFLEMNSDADLADVAFTLAEGRTRLPVRDAIVASSPAVAAATLRARRSAPAKALDTPRVIFVFPGQGVQRVGMCRELYNTESVFRRELDTCDRILAPLLGQSLLSALYPDTGTSNEALNDLESSLSNGVSGLGHLDQTNLAQPAIFAVCYALARLWESWGIRPATVVGHSIGEFVAATVAGALSLDDALALIAARGRLMQQRPTGAMLAVRASEEGIRALLPATLDLAAVNAPQAVTVSGPADAIDAFAVTLTAQGIAAKRLITSHGFHSRAMDSVPAGLRAALPLLAPAAPRLPWISSFTGAPVTAENLSGWDWALQAREPVRFAEAIRAAHATLAGDAIFLEVGPAPSLEGAIRQTLAGTLDAGRILASLTPAVGAPASNDANGTAAVTNPSNHDGILPALARLAALGLEPQWERLRNGRPPRRILLPTYPFERKRFWVDAPPAVAIPAGAPQTETSAAAAQPSTAVPASNPSPDPTSGTDMAITSPVSPISDTVPKADTVLDELKAMVAELSDLDLSTVPATTSFVELGLDSLFLTQLTQSIRARYGVKLTFRQIMGEFGTFATLTDHLRPHAPASAPAAPIEPVAASPAVIPAMPMPPTGTPAEGYAALFAQQMQAMADLMQRQLAVLAANGMAPAPSPAPSPASAAAPPSATAAGAVSLAKPLPSVARQKAAGNAAPEATLGTMVPLKPLELRQEAPLTTTQKEHVSGLIARYNARTAASKQHVQQYRDLLADPRVASGFHPEWKELVYPLVVERAQGPSIWDKDGNRYIDILNGYGSILFGHSPQFVTDAVRAQLELGFPIGPQTELAGECAALIAGMTGMERVSFCNTGSEAVMAAMRLARTVTGRDLIVLFSGAYHGMIDEVLVKSTRSERSIPAAPGIPQESVHNMLVLEYGSPAALEVIRRRKNEIAAVLVEPVQSRHPSLRPVEFLRELRAITEESGAALVFDEVVTGFRTHPGGAQALFGIRADIATYGKVVAGGMPIGVIAGSRTYMDALDGGSWRFGDDSIPQAGVTFFAGTFVRHPLTMAAVRAALTHLKEAGPSLQESLSGKSAALAGDLQALFAEYNFPSQIESFSSWFFFPSPVESRLARLVYYHLREQGIHLQEGFPCFLTTAHTDADLAQVRSGFRTALEAMRAGEALPVAGTRVAPTARVAAEATAGVANQIADEAPITEPQREVLLASQLDAAASCAFNESVTLHLDGPLDREALARSFDTLVARHEALRLTITRDGERIHVADAAALSIREEDWSTLLAEEQDARRHALLEDEASTPFDLFGGADGRSPLVRAILLKLAPAQHALILTAHHIVLDGWSINVLFEELGLLYSAARTRSTPELLPPHSLLEQARAEHAARSSAEGTAIADFWKSQYTTLPEPLQLPTDRPRPALRSHAGATYRHLFSGDFLARLRAASQQGGTTLFVTLLSTYAALLGRLTGQNDIVIGVPMAGQRDVPGKSFVGHAVNFLPLRIRPDANSTFAALANDVQNTVYDALDHQHYTLLSLIQQLKIVRDPSRLPLAEVQFNLEQVGSRLSFEGLTAQLDPNPKTAASADLFFNFVDRGVDLLLDCDYNTSLYDRETIARWIEALALLATDAAANPTHPIGELRMLSSAELEEQLIAWNQTATDYPRESSIAQLFREQAARTPDAIAVVWPAGSDGSDSLTYRELDARSDAFAAWLTTEYGKHIDSDSGLRIAISMERAPEQIVALLGTLKAGGMYVPIDPEYPAARVAMLLDDAEPQVLVTQQRLAERFSRLAVPTIAFESLRLAPATAATPLAVAATAPAYMIYTSGSTGKPKGVVVPHRAVIRLVSNTNYAHFGPDEVILQLAPVTFDASTFEIWGALLNGGRLVLMPGAKPAPEEIGAAIRQHGITTLWLTAALFHLMVMDHLDALKPLRQLLAGGDVLSVAHVRTLLEAAPRLRLINGYGPTENTTFTCCHTIQLADLDRGTVPIGQPIANTRVYLLDEAQRPVPVGVPGELCAAGDGLALGYLNAPDLTAAKFVEFRLEAGAHTIAERVYRTGDLARYTRDGLLEFLGRRDAQIKIRGYRIELGEIEHAAEQFPEVRAAVACARADWTSAEDVPGDKRLALYAISRNGMEPARFTSELREYLRTQLPEHMQPQAIVLVPSFPRTTNGKVDYRALPSPQLDHAASERTLQPPRTPLEEQLAAIFSRVLGVASVSMDDSIFELGGDSLSIFRITTQATQAGIAVTAKQLFQSKNISTLAAEIEKARREGSDTGTPATHTIKAIARDRFRKVQAV
ncbi:MAG TPA: amino acid adenylation domain-containing protein [Acidobacteriaceae bacterium]|jgi:amino acid adenylation domain-containing protein